MRSNNRNFLRAEEGNIAILFAFTLGALMLFAGGAVDFSRYNAVRADTIESLDAAGLAIAQLDAANGPEIRNLDAAARTQYLKDFGRKFFHENFKHEAVVDNLSVDFQFTNEKITPIGSGSLKTILLPIGQDLLGSTSGNLASLDLGTDTEITRAATGNTEVALVLDTTGSMAYEGRINDLKDAAKEFVDVLVRDDQSQYYSKVAIVPYSMAVNVGANATAARGAVAAPVSISGITKARPAVVTANNHGFVNGEYVYISGVHGMTQINNKVYKLYNVTANSFALKDVYGNRVDSRSYSSYSSGGDADCTSTGCKYKYFTNQNGYGQLFQVSTCVSERTGVDAYTDTDVAVSKVGYVYAGSNNPCTGPQLFPLSSDKTALKAEIDTLSAGGSTGGHVGVGWGWYAVSPNFASIFTGASAPAAYDAKVVKSVVIMTDGEYNSVYCQGVISQSSTSGSGSSNDHINCNAPNGDSFSQAQRQCDAMKAAGVKVYTVGFKIVDNQNARDLMTNCASGPSFRYLAQDGAALKRAFADIAQNIAQLHVSK